MWCMTVHTTRLGFPGLFRRDTFFFFIGNLNLPVNDSREHYIKHTCCTSMKQEVNREREQLVKSYSNALDLNLMTFLLLYL